MLINKLEDNKYTLNYQQLDQDIKIVLYTDAAFGNLDDGVAKNVMLFIVDKNGKGYLLS